jgi:cell division protein FtsL
MYRKTIDNSRVVRQADPQAGRQALKMIGSVTIAALMLICILLPGAYNLMAGYQLGKLKAQNTELRSEQAALEIQAEALSTPSRLLDLAAERKFQAEGQNIVFLERTDGSSVAMQRNGDASDR